MNIFEIYLDKIKLAIVELNKKGEIIIPETFNGINADLFKLEELIERGFFKSI